MPPYCVLEVAFRTWFALLLSRYVLVTARLAIYARDLAFYGLVLANVAMMTGRVVITRSRNQELSGCTCFTVRYVDL